MPKKPCYEEDPICIAGLVLVAVVLCALVAAMSCALGAC